MEILYLLIPLSLALVALVIWALFWAVKSGQFEDLDGPAWRILMDDDRPRKSVDLSQPPGTKGSISSDADSGPADARPWGSKPMSQLMEQLKTDHRNVASMLDLLESQLDAVHHMEHADFELMHDVMLYMTQYPDRVHHPLEDLVFDRMDLSDGTLARSVSDLRREHVALAGKGIAFLEQLKLIVDGSMVERKVVEETGRDYVAFMRHHMVREDQEVFPTAESQLGEEDWAQVAAAIEAREDPIFGPIVAEQFRSLLAHIRQESAED